MQRKKKFLKKKIQDLAKKKSIFKERKFKILQKNYYQQKIQGLARKTIINQKFKTSRSCVAPFLF
jgi:hypothetical protein